ncbi:MAG: PLP-dependent aminotransferase family protein [Cyanobacteria bacterium J06598_1]
MENVLALDLRPDTGVPLHQQVYEQIRAAILAGRVRSRQKLPSSRQLASSLNLSRTTVTQSYDQLISEGYLETRRGAGTFVCAQVPDALLSLDAHKGAPLSLTGTLPPRTLEGFPKADAPRNSVADEPPSFTLSTYGQRLSKTIEPPKQDPTELSFRYWRPDLNLFPVKRWQRLVNRHCAASDRSWMTYSTKAMGHWPLREEIATYIAQSRAVRCTPEQILITQGTQQALGLMAQVLLEEGDAVALEDPGYLSARKIFTAHGALTFPVAVDEEGLQVNQLAQLSLNITPIKLVYVTPSHQFPTGFLMSLPRRLALLEWAQKTGSLIIEDDYDSEFRYSGRPIPALQGLDRYQRVLYVGTFSKVMFPGLRLGYVVLPPALVPVFQRAKWVCDRQSSLLHQAALTDFIAEGQLAKHIRRMRSIYEKRRQRLIDLLQEISRDLGGVEIAGDPAGLHFMARLPLNQIGCSAKQLVTRAKAQGVNLFDITPYYHPDTLFSKTSGSEKQPTRLPERSAFIFGFGGLNETTIERAIAGIRPLFEKPSPR